MKVLFDQGTPVPLRRHLAGHEVATATERNCSQLTNGELLSAATGEGFEVLVTTDQNLRYQQNLKDRTISIVVLMTTSWPRIAKQATRVVSAIEASKPGTYTEVEA